MKRTAPVLDAIWQALAAASKLADSEQALELRDRCLAYEHIDQSWEHEPPTPEEREDLMKRVMALQVLVARAYRTSYPPPGA
jgi:hypothetical protein